MPGEGKLDRFTAFFPVIDPNLGISFFGQDVRWPIDNEHHPSICFSSLLVGSKEVIGEKYPIVINAY